MAKTKAATRTKASTKTSKTTTDRPQLTEAEQAITTKYGIEVKPGSMKFDESLGKKTLVMYCVICHKPRTIATQDAFQVRTCGEPACKKAHQKASK